MPVGGFESETVVRNKSDLRNDETAANSNQAIKQLRDYNTFLCISWNSDDSLLSLVWQVIVSIKVKVPHRCRGMLGRGV